MKTSTSLVWLSAFIAMLALVAATGGLFWPGGDGPFTFTTLRGAQVAIYGQGLYHYDTPIVALGFKMADAVTLSVAIPLLILALVRYRRGALRDPAGGGVGLLSLQLQFTGAGRSLQQFIQ